MLGTLLSLGGGSDGLVNRGRRVELINQAFDVAEPLVKTGKGLGFIAQR